MISTDWCNDAIGESRTSSRLAKNFQHFGAQRISFLGCSPIVDYQRWLAELYAAFSASPIPKVDNGSSYEEGDIICENQFRMRVNVEGQRALASCLVKVHNQTCTTKLVCWTDAVQLD